MFLEWSRLSPQGAAVSVPSSHSPTYFALPLYQARACQSHGQDIAWWPACLSKETWEIMLFLTHKAEIFRGEYDYLNHKAEISPALTFSMLLSSLVVEISTEMCTLLEQQVHPSVDISKINDDRSMH